MLHFELLRDDVSDSSGDDTDDETSSDDDDDGDVNGPLAASAAVGSPSRVPPYVVATVAHCRRCQPLSIVSGIGSVRLSIDVAAVRAGRARPRLSYSLYFDDESTALMSRCRERPRTLLSVCVYRQTATAMPVDCVLTIWGAPRPYVVRRRVAVTGLAEELVTDGVVYVDGARSLAFCSLDAAGFARSRAPLCRLGDGRVLVPRSYTYARLLRAVVMARQLEAMDALSRRCARALSTAPLDGSDVLVFADAAAVDDAIAYIEHELVPHTRRVVDAQRPRFNATSLTHASWSEALDAKASTSARTEFSASVNFRVYFVV